MSVAPSIFRREIVARALLVAACGLAAPVRGADPAALQQAPLAAPSASPSARLFTLLPPELTGVVATNNYTDPKMWDSLYHEFEVGAVGTGVAVGDFDHDGRPDIFVVSKTESCRLFRNLGGWKFADVTTAAGVADIGEAARIWKQGAAFADVNNDGWLDLYVCRFGAPNLLYINQGGVTFREEAAARGLALNDASGMAAFCDYDRDGWLDVFIQTNLRDAAARPDGQEDHLYRNNRDGTFTETTVAAGIGGATQGHAAIWWDYDEDGWPDLYLANDFKAPDKLYRNQRNGAFRDVAATVLPHTPYSSMGADLGDLDNDGHLDFLVADMAASTVVKDQRGMVASRARATKDPVDDPAAGAPQYSRNALYLHSGPARFREAACLAGLDATDWTWSVRFEDFDNDGRLDAWFTNGMVRELHNTDLLNRMVATESARERVRVMQSSPPFNEPNLAFRNLGDLRFENTAAAWGLDQNGVSFGAATGDFDGDGDLDVVFTNYRAGPTLLRNDSATGHRAIVALRGTTANKFGVGAKVSIETISGPQVRELVLARGYLSTSEPVLHFGLGADERISRLTVTWPGGHTQTFTDLPADRRFTITESAPSADSPSAAPSVPATPFVEVSVAAGFQLTAREEPVDESALQPLLPLRFNARGPALASGDFNADGWPDLVLGGTPRDPLRLLAGQKGGFTAPVTVAAARAQVNDGPLLVFDANGDRHADLLLTRGGAGLPNGMADYQPQLWLGDGTGGLVPAPVGSLPEWRTTTGAAIAADWDHDGRPDVFIGGRLQPGDYPQPPRSALWANRGGRFTDVTDSVLPALRDLGMVTAALWSDADGDGWVDLLVALDWGEVKYFHNEAGRGFTDRTVVAGFATAGTGWWSSLAVADFNGDGRLDYAAGNLGLNTEYRASPADPAVLFQGDFKGDGSSQLIEGRSENGKLHPRRGRRELGALIPAVLKKYPRNDAFAQATLPEILGETALAAATRLVATEFRSGVFLSQPDGTWLFSPLPRLAQIAPIQGLAAGDFDGDGRADLYVLQNSHAPVPSVGRFDGGLSQLLRGDGRGGFVAVPPGESGLVVPGDARALLTLDLEQDGRPDFIVTRNNAPALVFRNQGTAHRRLLLHP